MLPIAADMKLPFLLFVTDASTERVSSMLWYEQIFLWLRAAEFTTLPAWRESQAEGEERTLPVHALWMELTKRFSRLAWQARKNALHELRTRLGISNHWDAEYSENEALGRRFLMLNLAELKELRRAGVTIGAHTMSHPMLSQMSPENAFEEMARSRTRLEDALGEPVWALAYPFGNQDAVSDRDRELASRAGFKCAFMNVEGLLAENRFSIPRVHVSLTMSLAEFDAHLSGFHHSIRTLASAAMPA